MSKIRNKSDQGVHLCLDSKQMIMPLMTMYIDKSFSVARFTPILFLKSNILIRWKEKKFGKYETDDCIRLFVLQ